MTETPQETNPTKIRLGLAVIVVIFVAASIMIVVADDAVSRAIFFAVAAMTLVRAALLVRWLRKQAAAERSA